MFFSPHGSIKDRYYGHYLEYEADWKRHVYAECRWAYTVIFAYIPYKIKSECLFATRSLWDLDYRYTLDTSRATLLAYLKDGAPTESVWIKKSRLSCYITTIMLLYYSYKDVFVWVQFYAQFFFTSFMAVIPVWVVKLCCKPDFLYTLQKFMSEPIEAEYWVLYMSPIVLVYVLPLLMTLMLYEQFRFMLYQFFSTLLGDYGWYVNHVYGDVIPLSLDVIPDTITPSIIYIIVYFCFYASIFPYYALMGLWYWHFLLGTQLLLIGHMIPSSEEFINGTVQKDEYMRVRLREYLDSKIAEYMIYSQMRDDLFQLHIFPILNILLLKVYPDPFKHIRQMLVYLEFFTNKQLLKFYGIFKYLLPRHHKYKIIHRLRVSVDRWFLTRKDWWEDARGNDYAAFKETLLHWLEFMVYRPLIFDARHSEMARLDIEMVAEGEFWLEQLKSDMGYDIAFSEGTIEVSSGEDWYKEKTEPDPTDADKADADEYMGSVDEPASAIGHNLNLDDPHNPEAQRYWGIQSMYLDFEDWDTTDFPYELTMRLRTFFFIPLVYLYILVLYYFVIYTSDNDICALLYPYPTIRRLIEEELVLWELFDVVFDDNLELFDTHYFNHDKIEEDPEVFDEAWDEAMWRDSYYSDYCWNILYTLRNLSLFMYYSWLWFKDACFSGYVEWVYYYAMYNDWVILSIRELYSTILDFFTKSFLPWFSGSVCYIPVDLQEFKAIIYFAFSRLVLFLTVLGTDPQLFYNLYVFPCFVFFFHYFVSGLFIFDMYNTLFFSTVELGYMCWLSIDYMLLYSKMLTVILDTLDFFLVIMNSINVWGSSAILFWEDADEFLLVFPAYEYQPTDWDLYVYNSPFWW